MPRLLRRSLSLFWPLAAALIIVLALLVSVGRLMLPMLADYRVDAERWLSEQLRYRVTISALSADWEGLYPVLRLHDVVLKHPDSGKTALAFSELRLAINPYQALISHTLLPHSVSVVGAQLAVERLADGAIRIQGMGLPTGSGLALDKLGGMALRLIDADISWRDAGHSTAPMLFTDVNLAFAYRDSHYHLAGSSELPAGLGRHLRFALDLTGALNAPGGWGGRLYLKGDDLNLQSWLGTREVLGASLTRGMASGEFWSEWRQARLVRFEGWIDARDTILSTGTQAEGFEVDALRTWLRWTRDDRGWRLDADQMSLSRGDDVWPQSGLSWVYHSDPDTGEFTLSGGMDFARLQDIALFGRLMPVLDEASRHWLDTLRPHGDLMDLRFRYHHSPEGPSDYDLDTRFSELGMWAWKKAPAATGLSGAVRLNEQHGVLTLDSSDATLEFANLFRTPLVFDRLQADFEWQRYADRWRIDAHRLEAANSDIGVTGRGLLDLPRDGAPFLDLTARFHDGRAVATPHYLPVGIMPPATVAWLDNAIKGGQVTQGGVVYHGHLNRFPFNAGEGTFLVDFDVNGASLAYAKGWPQLEDVGAHVEFRGRGMTIQAQSARLYDTQLVTGDVHIDDLPHAELHVNVTAQGSHADVLRFLHESPIVAGFDDVLTGIQAQGAGPLTFAMTLPLHQGGTARVNGSTTFSDAGLSLPRWGVDLTKLTGPLAFTETGLTSDGLTGMSFERPMRLIITRQGTGTARVNRFELRGTAPAGVLARRYPAALWRDIAGESAFRLRLDVPEAAQRNTLLHLDSDLIGMSVDLPAPFGKTATEARELSLNFPLTTVMSGPLALSYGEHVRGLFEFTNLQGQPALARGMFGFDSEAVLPDGSGLYLGGRLGSVTLDDWQALSEGASPSGAILPDWFNGCDLQMPQLEMHGTAVHDVRLAARRADSGWQLDIAAREIAGRIMIPDVLPDGPPLVMTLDHVEIAPDSGDEDDRSGVASRRDPRTLPAMRINAERFSYHGNDYGRLTLNTSRQQDGMRVDELLLDSPALQLTANGTWRAGDKGHTSDFDIVVKGPSLDHILSKFGYTGDIRDAETYADLNAQWPDSPMNFSLGKLSGSLKVKIGAGRFVDVEPGAGRVFGLLNLNELTRRLKLDFTDLFKKGFTFDKINGKFEFADGNAYTDDLTVEGPAARIEISGRTGIAAGDYDQLVSVYPTFGAGIPLAGAIANPGVGAALFVTQKLFKDQIEEMTREQYTVTGSWEAPVITRLAKNAPAPTTPAKSAPQPDAAAKTDSSEDSKQQVGPGHLP